MSYGVELLNPSLEQYENLIRTATGQVTLTGSATLSSISVGSDNPGMLIYAKQSGQPTTIDPGATFGTLVSTSSSTASTVGLLVLCYNADPLFAPIATIQGPIGGTSAMTAAVATLVGLNSTGVTASIGGSSATPPSRQLGQNIAIVLSCTSLYLNSAVAATFTLSVKWRALPGT